MSRFATPRPARHLQISRVMWLDVSWTVGERLLFDIPRTHGNFRRLVGRLRRKQRRQAKAEAQSK